MAKRHTAFSLVELLVAIAIVSVLAAMLLPGLEKSLEISRRIPCANGLRQMYIIAADYGTENGGWLPYAYESYVGGNNDCLNTIMYGWAQPTAEPVAANTYWNNGWGTFFSGTYRATSGGILNPGQYQSPMMPIPLITCPSRTAKHSLFSVTNSNRWGVRGHYSYRFNGGYTLDPRYYADAKNLKGHYRRDALSWPASGKITRYALFWDTGAYMFDNWVISPNWAHQDGGNVVDFSGATAFVPNLACPTSDGYSWPSGDMGYGTEILNATGSYANYGIDAAFSRIGGL